MMDVLFKLDVHSHTYGIQTDGFTLDQSVMNTVGAIIFIVFFFGCCGAIRENPCMLTTVSSMNILAYYEVEFHFQKIMISIVYDNKTSLFTYSFNCRIITDSFNGIILLAKSDKILQLKP